VTRHPSKDRTMSERTFEFRLSWWRNIETGLVRSFLSPPKRGKWIRLACPRYPLPLDTEKTG
jgi:hypothetical protein